ncbi:sulfite exporter TauE/SafE [bacterium BMS3Bbin10]|nr:sulfite exporter TauE/SafE [bacterium BMS3Bbin10]HDL17105.1 sulfite exporter TauE/SafE family protein [Hyphomicrobiales bacterium]
MGVVETAGIVAVAFLLAGFVKGVIGMGLPTVSLALLALTLGLKEAMALMLIPAIATNLWQGLAGGNFKNLMKRIWPLLLAACPAIWVGAGVLARASALHLAAVLGAMIFIYAALALARIDVPAPGRHERWMSPLVGGATGILTGLTGSFVMPAVPYLQALGLSRHELVQAMGISFSVSMLALALALAGHSLLPADLGLMSAGALVPAAAGMMLGIQVRKRLSEDRFRKIFFVALALLGAWLALRPWVL